MTEDEMVRWHHRLSGHEFEQALGDGAVLSDEFRKQSVTGMTLPQTAIFFFSLKK